MLIEINYIQTTSPLVSPYKENILIQGRNIGRYGTKYFFEPLLLLPTYSLPLVPRVPPPPPI